MAYEAKYRERVVEYLKEGHTRAEAKNVFKVGISTMKVWVKQSRELGHLRNKPLNRSFKKIDPEKLKKYVEEHPDAYLKEIAEEFNCCTAAVYFVMQKLKITRKKKSKFIKKEVKSDEKNSSRRYRRLIPKN